MADQPTTFTSIVGANSIGVQTVLDAYDMAIDWELRSQPLFRNAATVKKRPQDLNNPGPTVRFTMNPYLGAAANTNLHEFDKPANRALPQAEYIDVDLVEFGDIVVPTFQLRTFSFTDVNRVVAQDISAAMADDVDNRVSTVLRGGTNVLYSVVGAPSVLPASGGTGLVDGALGVGDNFSSKLARFVSAQMRADSAIPLGDDGEYLALIHPHVEHDLRAETGAGGWREVHELSAAGNIWRGNIGIYEGLAYVTSPRVHSDDDGAGATAGDGGDIVYRTIVLGAQALAEAVAVEPHMVIGPVTDPFNRHRPAGYHALAGWGRYREDCLWRVETTSTVSATATA